MLTYCCWSGSRKETEQGIWLHLRNQICFVTESWGREFPRLAGPKICIKWHQKIIVSFCYTLKTNKRNQTFWHLSMKAGSNVALVNHSGYYCDCNAISCSSPLTSGIFKHKLNVTLDGLSSNLDHKTENCKLLEHKICSGYEKYISFPI